MKKFLLLALLLSGCTPSNAPSNAEVSALTVKVTNLAGNSGGSGTIVLSTASESIILTNDHVCGVVVNGGWITHTASRQRAEVVSYRKSTVHDLCFIRVNYDFGTPALKIAENAPKQFDNVTISGHPSLYPVIVSRGSYGGRINVTVNTGFRECTEADKADPVTGLFCAIMGKIPMFKSYDAAVTGATIMPGSSGSGVFNDNNELIGVAFAGAGELGYSLIVPLEFVKAALVEAPHIAPTPVKSDMDLAGQLTHSNSDKLLEQVSRICAEYNNNPICRKFSDSNKTVNLQ